MRTTPDGNPPGPWRPRPGHPSPRTTTGGPRRNGRRQGSAPATAGGSRAGAGHGDEGTRGTETPIMVSRVARDASSSSDIASVPAGRIGRTR